MAFIPVDKFPHNQIIAKANISLSDLDDNLKTVITSFNKKHNGYKLKVTDAAEKELMALSTMISQHIYDYYIDEEDQEIVLTPGQDINPAEVKKIVEEIKEEEKTPTPAPEPTPTPTPKPTPAPAAEPTPAPETPKPAEPTDVEPTNKNERALYLLFKEGVTSGITKSMLASKGFNTEIASIRGCKVGGYRLHKEFSETSYNLDKI